MSAEELTENEASPCRLPFHPERSSAPGTSVSQIDFSVCRERVPFQASRFEVRPGSRSKPDVHAVVEAWMVASGTGKLTHDGVEHRIKAGDVMYFRPRTEHVVENDGDESLVLFSSWWSAE